jgi:uncharacterized protein (DUF58 family)
MKGSRRQPGLELIDPAALASLDDFELIARWVVEGFMHGLHTSPYVGFSVEFASHREYLPGDDLRHLNWKLFGRHDKLYIKQYDADTNLEMHIVLDVSQSMTAGGGPLNKLKYASMLSAALAHLAHSQRDAVGITLFADRILEHVRPRASSDHLMSLLQVLANAQEHPRAESPQVLHEVAEMMPRRGMVALISDLYFDPEELLASLNHFRHFGHDILVFHTLEPLERHLNVDGSVRFRDLETGEEIVAEAHAVRASFASAVEDWIGELEHGCLTRDMDYRVLLTSTPLEEALWQYFIRRAQLY